MNFSWVCALVSDSLAFFDICCSDASSEAVCVLAAMMIAVVIGRLRSSRMRASRLRSQIFTASPQMTWAALGHKTQESLSAEGADVDCHVQAQCREIAVAVRKGRAVDVLRLMSAARSRDGDNPESNAADAKCCQRLDACLRACCANRDFEKALAVYDQVGDTVGDGSSSTWSLLLYCAVEAQQFQSCELFIKRLMEKGLPSHNDFVNMVRYYVTLDDTSCFSSALSVLNANGYGPDVLARNRALAVCIGTGRLQLVEAVLVGTAGVPVDTTCYNTLIRVYGQSGQLLRCFKLLADMRAQGIVPNDVTFGVLLSVCVQNRNIKAAKRAFEDLKTSGIEVNRVHYTTLMQGFAQAGRLDDANEILDEMMASRSARPDIVTYTTLVKAHAEQGHTDESLRVVEHMHEEGIIADTVVFNLVIAGCCSAPMSPEKVLRTFDRLVELGLEPSIATFSVLLKALAHQEGWNEAVEFLSRLQQRFRLKPAPRLFDQLASACRRAGRFCDARKIQVAAREAARGEALVEDTSV